MFKVARRWSVVLLAMFALSHHMQPVLGGCCCPALWTAFGNNCYRYFNTPLKNWYDAEKFCRLFTTPSRGDTTTSSQAHLVSIHSQDENDFVYSLYESSRSKHPQENRGSSSSTYNVYRMFLGLEETDDSVRWTDGSSVDFVNWAPGQPSNTNERCGEMLATLNGGKWNDIPTSYTSNFLTFMCKMTQN